MSENKELWTILHELRHTITNSRHSVSFPKKSIVDSLLEHLQKGCEDVQYECLLLLSAVIPKLEDELDHLLADVIPEVFKLLGRKDLQVKMATMNFIYAYLKNTGDLQKFMKQFVNHVLNNFDQAIQHGGILCATALLQLLLKDDNIILLLESVTKLLKTKHLHLLYSTFYMLKRIQLAIGDKKFYNTVKSSKTNVSRLYLDLQSGRRPSSNIFPISYDELEQVLLEQVSMEDELKRYEIMHTIRTQIQTIGWTVSDLLPHIDHFVNFLSRLCTDSSLKIRMLSLDILEVLIERTDCEVVMHLEMFMECLLKCLACCDRKISKKSTQLIHRLMHYVHPMAVIQQLLENIHGRNSSLRVEIINRITAGLFYCSLYSFDLNHLCFVITPFLEDSVLQVRQATVECLVTLGYVMLMTGHPLIDFGEYLKKACHISKSSLKVIISRARKGWLPSCSIDGHIWNVNCFPPGADSTFGNTSDDSCLTSRASTADSRWKVKQRNIFTLPKTVVDDHLSTKTQKSVVNEIHSVKHPLDLHKNLHFGNEKATSGFTNHIESEEVKKDELTPSQLFSRKYVTSVHVSMGKHNVVNEDDSSFSEATSEVFTPQLSMCYSNQYPESATSSVHVGDHPNESSFRKSLSVSSVEDSLNKKEHDVNEASAISIDKTDVVHDKQKTITSAVSLVSCGNLSDCPTISEFSYVATAEDSNINENQTDFVVSSKDGCGDAIPTSTLATLQPENTSIAEKFDLTVCQNMTGVKVFRPSPHYRNFNILTISHPAKSDKISELSGSSHPSTPDNVHISLPTSIVQFNSMSDSKLEIDPIVVDDDDENDITITECEEDDSYQFLSSSNEKLKQVTNCEKQNEDEIQSAMHKCNEVTSVTNGQSISCSEILSELMTTDEEVISRSTLGDSKNSSTQHVRKTTYTLKKEPKVTSLKVKRKQNTNRESKHLHLYPTEDSNKSDIASDSSKVKKKCLPKTDLAGTQLRKRNISKNILNQQKFKSIKQNVNSKSMPLCLFSTEDSNKSDIVSDSSKKKEKCLSRSNLVITQIQKRITSKKLLNRQECKSKKQNSKSALLDETLHMHPTEDSNKSDVESISSKVESKCSSKSNLATTQLQKRSASKKLFNHKRYRSRKYTRMESSKKSPKQFENWLKRNLFFSGNSVSVRRSNWLTNALAKSFKNVMENTYKHKEQIEKETNRQVEMQNEIADLELHAKVANQSNTKLSDKLDEISPKKVQSRKALLRLGPNKSKSLINNVIDEDDDAFEKMIADAQSEIKLIPERRASEQWSSNIDFPLRCRTCHWADSFEEKIRNQDPFEKSDQPQLILKQACDALSDNDIPRKDVSQKDEYVTKKEDTMLSIVRIAKFHPELLEEYQLNKIIVNLLTETKNLRASIAGQAVLTIGYLFMLKPLDSKLRIVLAALLGKSGNRTFAGSYNAVIKSIFYLLKGVSLQKSVMAMILEGAKHPNKAVRETAAQFLSLLTQKLGPNKSLTSNLVNPMLSTAAQFVMDGSPLTRHCGKLMFSTFMMNKNFDVLKKKHISEKVQLSISKILQTVTNKGVEKETLPIDVIWHEEF